MFDLLNRSGGLLNDFFEITPSRNMRTNIEETDKEFNFLIEVPGFNKEDIKISINDSHLVVEATHTSKKEEEEKNYIRKEINKQTMSRSFHVGNVAVNDLKASLDDGILKIVVPKEAVKYLEIE